MPFLSLWFYFAVVLLLALYYGVPVRARWTVLLAGSLVLYCCFSGMGILALGFTALAIYATGRLLKKGKGQRALLAMGIGLVLLPFLGGRLFYREGLDFLRPLGIAYFTLQAIAYMADVYRGEIEPEKNLAKYMLFLSFFPRSCRGPSQDTGSSGGSSFRMRRSMRTSSRGGSSGFCGASS